MLAWSTAVHFFEGRSFPGAHVIYDQIRNGVEKVRIGLIPEGRAPVRGGVKLYKEQEGTSLIGEVTSGGYSPSLGHPISMGYVDSNYSSIDTKIFLEIRGKKVSANICKLPFYKKNYVKEV